MRQMQPQAWQREPFRQALAPFSSRILHFIESAIQSVRKMIMFREVILAKPSVISDKFRSDIKTAILAGIIVMLGRAIIAAGLITAIPEMLGTRQVQAKVVTRQSGYATSVDKSLVPLNNSLQMIGDDDQDRQVKLFLTYNFGSIPEYAKISRARLSFKCTLKGDISGFGDLSVHRVAFDDYSEGIFDSFPVDNMTNNIRARIFLVGNAPILSGCNADQTIDFSNEALAQIVESQKGDGKINLVVYFEDKSILANQQADGIQIDTLPQLDVSYTR